MNHDIFQCDAIKTQYSSIPSFHHSNCERSELSSLWNGDYREEMYQGLETAEYYTQYRDEKSWSIYEALVLSASHWDTLDWIAGKLVSPLVRRGRHLEEHLVAWSKSDNFWVRRASLLAHLHQRDETNTQLLADTILRLAHEKEFFIRKAIGWILRDYSYANPQWVKNFVDRHQSVISALSRREALRHIKRG
jgi:3-methyladenine DNA glycosylase AlkD